MTKVIHLITSLTKGGRERQLSVLASNVDSIQVLCFNKKTNTYIDDYGLKNVSYIRVNSFFGRMREVRSYLRRSEAQVIWSWGTLEALFCFLLRLTCDFYHINGSIRHGIFQFRRKHILRLVLVQLSKYRVANSLSGLRANLVKKGYILHNGIDASFFCSVDSITEKEILTKYFRIISVANLVPYKDYFTVLKALHKLKSEGYRFKYKIIGDGPLKEQIVARVSELDLRQEVVLLGRRSDVSDLLKNSDLFVHSSKGEGLSNAILEAMAAGLPCIATNTGGTKELLSSSLLFEYKNSEQLATLLRKMMSDREYRVEVSKTLNDFVRQENSLEKMVKEYKRIIEQVIKSSEK